MWPSVARRLHIAICGAGPAGLATAIALGRQGHRIVLFDQFDVPKPLGSGIILQPTGLAVLDWLGVGQRIRQLGAPIDRLFGRASRTGKVVLDVSYAHLGEARGLAVHRAALFNVLWDAAKASGIDKLTPYSVSHLDHRRVVSREGRREGPFDLVVDALGSRSPLIAHAAAPDCRKPLNYGAIWTSLPWPGGFLENALEQRYDKANVMIGVLPLGRQLEEEPLQTAFFWSLRSDAYEQWLRQGLPAWKSKVLSLWPQTATLLDKINDPEQMVMARYDHHTLTLPFGDSLVFVGDSAHSTSPQLGQGANMALLDAQALAQALESHSSVDGAVRAYARQRRWHVKLYQALSQIFTPFYQSDSLLLPLLRDTLAADASRLPGAPWLLAKLTSGSLGLR